MKLLENWNDLKSRRFPVSLARSRSAALNHKHIPYDPETLSPEADPIWQTSIWWFLRSGTKEIVERRHGEPIIFLFLPKMGLLGSQAGNEKTCWLWIMSNFWGLFFQILMIKSFFGGLKTVFIRASCFGYRVKGVCPLLLPVVSLIWTQIIVQVFKSRNLEFRL